MPPEVSPPQWMQNNAVLVRKLVINKVVLSFHISDFTLPLIISEEIMQKNQSDTVHTKLRQLCLVIIGFGNNSLGFVVLL